MNKHANYSKNVFINCPFDDEYFELRQIIVFTIVYFGFKPRISLESSDSGMPRLQKISELIKESRYSIHDLSRLQAKSIDEYYRLNMPFEMGIDYGLRIYNDDYKDKRSLILETKPYDYMKAISDINGFDIKNHNDTPEKLVECLRAWFSETVEVMNLNGSAKAYSDFIEFNKYLFENRNKKYLKEHNSSEAEKLAVCEIDEITLPEFIKEVEKWLTTK